ncbi:gluconokinase [Catellatospora citrea]|uniref:Gluconokinase n=2 Tax=Catellatospora citrea TaxID=53366 RepID=A0A8J3NWL1_9ACTN|nr:gluconate kinase (SKI family) [Catellatospora citrea]GIF95157.1 gluconokinase [Catellatospora citrea]
MGVSGSGKSTIGTRLAERLGAVYADGDDLHPQANVQKMSAGIPLTDADRAPWLRLCAQWLAEQQDEGIPAVLACSALKRSYRDLLREAAPGLAVVYLDGSPELLASRLSNRPGHFFNPRLLDSQLADLEKPGDDESAIVIPITLTPDEIIDQAMAALSRA